MAQSTKGLVAVLSCCCAIFWSGAFIFGFSGVMAFHWTQMFHVGRGAIGNILFFVLAAVGSLMFVVGRWQEKFGARTMMLIGTTVTGLAMFIIPWASTIFEIYLWAFVMGGASAFIYVPALTVVQKWYPLRRGLVSGIVNLTFALSAALMTPVFGILFDAVGYVPMVVILAAFALLMGVPGALFAEAPETDAQPAGGSVSGLPLDPSLTAAQSLRSPAFWFLWLVWALQGAAGISMVTLSTTFGLSQGLNLESAVIILTAFNLTNGLSRFVAGYLSDKIGRNFIMSLTFVAAGIAYLLFPRAEGVESWALLSAVIGFAFGTLFAVSAPLVTDCFGITHFGTVFGLVFTAYGFVAGIIGPSLTGYLLDTMNGNYYVVFGYLGGCCLLSSVLVQFVRARRVVAGGCGPN